MDLKDLLMILYIILIMSERAFFVEFKNYYDFHST